MHRHVPHQHRVVREVRIEVVAGQAEAVRHHGVVIAVGLDHLAPGHFLLVTELLQLRDDARDVFAGPGRQREDVDLVGHGDRVDVVAVGVQEAGQHGLAGEVHDRRGLPLVGTLDLATRTDGEFAGLATATHQAISPDADALALRSAPLLTDTGRRRRWPPTSQRAKAVRFDADSRRRGDEAYGSFAGRCPRHDEAGAMHQV